MTHNPKDNSGARPSLAEQRADGKAKGLDLPLAKQLRAGWFLFFHQPEWNDIQIFLIHLLAGADPEMREEVETAVRELVIDWPKQADWIAAALEVPQPANRFMARFLWIARPRDSFKAWQWIKAQPWAKDDKAGER